MIIDFHTHTFPDDIAERALNKLKSLSHTATFTDGTNSGLLESMERAAIDLSLIMPVATKPEQVRKINDRALELNREFGFCGGKAVSGRRLLSFAAIHPECEDWEEELDRVAEEGFPGIKIHPPYQKLNLDDPSYIRIAKKAGDLGLIIVSHAGFDVGLPFERRCSPKMIIRLFEGAGNIKLVLAHMGGWRMWHQVTDMLVDTPAYLDTSFSTGKLVPLDDGYYTKDDLPMLYPDEFKHMIRMFGSDRILFATDSPWSGQTESVNWIRDLNMSESDKDAIFGGNAERLLKKVL